MRYLILFCACLYVVPLSANAGGSDKKSPTVAAVTSLSSYCLESLQNHRDPAAFAVSKGLEEFPEEQARKFSPNGGRVFAITEARGNAVLMTNEKYAEVCSIAVHEITPADFWSTLDSTLTGFSLLREKRVEKDRMTKKEYERSNVAGTLALLVTASDVPRPNGMQALMTLARVKK